MIFTQNIHFKSTKDEFKPTIKNHLRLCINKLFAIYQSLNVLEILKLNQSQVSQQFY